MLLSSDLYDLLLVQLWEREINSIFNPSSVTRWLDYLFNSWPSITMKIFPLTKGICRSKFKILINAKTPQYQYGQSGKTSGQIWSHWTRASSQNVYFYFSKSLKNVKDEPGRKFLDSIHHRHRQVHHHCQVSDFNFPEKNWNSLFVCCKQKLFKMHKVWLVDKSFSFCKNFGHGYQECFVAVELMGSFPAFFLLISSFQYNWQST